MRLGTHTEANEASRSNTGLLYGVSSTNEGEVRVLEARPENLDALSLARTLKVESTDLSQIKLSPVQQAYLESFGGTELLDENSPVPLSFIKEALQFVDIANHHYHSIGNIGFKSLAHAESNSAKVYPNAIPVIIGQIIGSLLTFMPQIVKHGRAFTHGVDLSSFEESNRFNEASQDSFKSEIQKIIRVWALGKVFRSHSGELALNFCRTEGASNHGVLEMNSLTEDKFPDNLQDEITLAKKEAAQHIRDMIRHFQLARIEEVKSAEYDSDEARKEAIDTAEHNRRKVGMIFIPILAEFLDESMDAMRESLMGPLTSELATSKADIASRLAVAMEENIEVASQNKELQANLTEALATITKLTDELEASKARNKALASTANAHLDTLDENRRDGGFMSKPSILYTDEVAQGMTDLRTAANS